MDNKKRTSKQATAPTPTHEPAAAAELKNDTANLGYKLRVLLYDLRNVGKDHTSESRTLATTHPTYISGPYFAPDEADTVLNSWVAVVVKETIEDMEGMNENGNTPTDLMGERLEQETEGVANGGKTTKHTMTVEQAIQDRLSRFFDKRRASGDARPCGPHDMAKIYEEIFNITRDEVEGDEKFLRRLRRCGV